jgi:hypothetical protein
MEVLTRKATQPPTPLSVIRQDLPPALSDLVMRMLASKPQDRPGSMEELAGELGALFGLSPAPATDRVVPIEPVQPSTTERVPRKRSAWVVGGLLAATAVFIVTAAFVSQMGASPSSVVQAKPLEQPPVSVVRAPEPAPEPEPEPPPPPKIAPKKVVVVPTPVTVRRPAEHKPVPPPAAPTADRRAEAQRLLKEARRALVAGSLGQAESLYEKVVETGFEKGPALTGLGECAFQGGNYADAVRRARKAVDAGGGVSARMVLGNAYFKLQQYDNAIGVYKEVLKLDGKHEEAQQNLAAAQRKRGG